MSNSSPETLNVRLPVPLTKEIDNLSLKSDIKKNLIMGTASDYYLSLDSNEQQKIREKYLVKYGNSPTNQRGYKLPSTLITNLKNEKKKKGIRSLSTICGAAGLCYFEILSEEERERLLSGFVDKMKKSKK